MADSIAESEITMLIVAIMLEEISEGSVENRLVLDIDCVVIVCVYSMFCVLCSVLEIAVNTPNMVSR